MPFLHLQSVTFPSYLTAPAPFRRKASAISSGGSDAGGSSDQPYTQVTQPPLHIVSLPHQFNQDRLIDPVARSPPLYKSTARPPSSFLTPDVSTAVLRCAHCLADLALASQIISKGFTGRHGRAYLVAPLASQQTLPTTRKASVALPVKRPVTGSSVDAQPLLSASAAGAVQFPYHQKQEHERHGSNDLPNTFVHCAVARHLVTGLHTVGDMSCAQCGTVLGWKYIGAEDAAQRYKIGKFILEARRVVMWGDWDHRGKQEEEEDEDERVKGEGGPVGGKGGEVEVEFDSQDEDECEDLFAGVWTPENALARRTSKWREQRDWHRAAGYRLTSS